MALARSAKVIWHYLPAQLRNDRNEQWRQLTMDAQLDHKGNLSLNLYDVLASLPPGALVDLVDALAVQDAVIEQVANQIATGWTDSVSCAACDDDAANPRYALGKARRFLALHADATTTKREWYEVRDAEGTALRRYPAAQRHTAVSLAAAVNELPEKHTEYGPRPLVCVRVAVAETRTETEVEGAK